MKKNNKNSSLLLTNADNYDIMTSMITKDKDNTMKMNPRDMDWKDFVHADHLTSLRDDDDSDDGDDDDDNDDDDKDKTMNDSSKKLSKTKSNIDTNKWYNVTYMNTITPYYWKERDGEYPHHGPVTAKQVSGERLAEMVANGGYFYNPTYPALEILKIEETHEITWEMVTSNGRWSCS